MKFLGWLTLIFFLGLPVSARAAGGDHVQLETGEQIDGIIIYENSRAVVITTSGGNSLTIPRSRIAHIQHANANGRSPASDGSTSSPATADSVAPTASITPTGTSEPTLPASPSGSEKPIYRFNLGPLLGMTFSNASLSPDTSTSERLGLLAGAFFEASLGKSFFLEPELMFGQLGYTYVFAGDADSFRYDALRVPILLEYKTDINERLRLVLLGGPSFAFRTSSSELHDGVTTDLSGTTNSVAFGLDVGVGLECPIKPTVVLFVEARHSFGLTDLSKTTPSIRTDDDEALAGLRLGL